MNYRNYSMLFVIFIGFISSISHASCPYGPDQCLPGYVWREAFSGDHVCVTGQTRQQAADDNAQAAQRRDPNCATGNCPYGPNQCLSGYVWRGASNEDYVCVSGQVRDQAKADNTAASSRRDPSCAADNLSNIRFETELPSSGPLPTKPSRTRTAISSDGTVIGISEGPLAGVSDKMWNAGDTLRIRMTGGSAIVRSKVREFAEEWTKYANIRFQFVDDSSPAEIKITFDKDKGSWSAVGRDALNHLFDTPTMNFDKLDDNSSNSDFGYYVLHEFGHALGLIHEHQSPSAGIPWDKNKVYKYYKDKFDWDKAKVDSNLFDRYKISSTNFSVFDPNSIMLYSYPAELTLDGSSHGDNRTLSSTDKEYIARWYPHPSADIGQLRTGDDCDEIDFQVKYGVEDFDKVRITLNPGGRVTWWKLIEIPIEANKYVELQINKGWLDKDLPNEQVLEQATLDASRPIRFNKAKFLGVHTQLGYTWDVLSALPGGSRVTLDWNRDSCGQ